jgi:surface antigen
MKITKVIAIGAVALSLAACANDGSYGNKQTVGTLLGAGTGALIGSQFGSGSGALAATAVGALAGAYLGSEAGKSLDRADQGYLARTTQSTLESAPTGRSSSWQNPDSGNSGTITPTRTFVSSSGQNCREFQQSIVVGGRTENAYGTACRQPDGSWKIVSQ